MVGVFKIGDLCKLLGTTYKL